MTAKLILKTDDGNSTTDFTFKAKKVEGFYIINDEEGSYILIQLNGTEYALEYSNEVYTSLLSILGYD